MKWPKRKRGSGGIEAKTVVEAVGGLLNIFSHLSTTFFWHAKLVGPCADCVGSVAVSSSLQLFNISPSIPLLSCYLPAVCAYAYYLYGLCLHGGPTAVFAINGDRGEQRSVQNRTMRTFYYCRAHERNEAGNVYDLPPIFSRSIPQMLSFSTLPRRSCRGAN